MGNDTQTSFNVRSVKGGYILSLANNIAYGGRGNESIHPSVDDLIQAIRFELDNPTPVTPNMGLTTVGVPGNATVTYQGMN